MAQNPMIPPRSGIDIEKIDAVLAKLEEAVETIAAVKARGGHVDPELEALLLARLEQFGQRIADTRLVLGNQVLEDCLAAYAALKAAGKTDKKLDDLHRALFDA